MRGWRRSGSLRECLAFSNVPDDDELARVAAAGAGGAHLPVPHLPAWKAGVPRDTGAGWDFEDVRDHYLTLLYGLDPVELRWTDPARYLQLGAAVTGEVMAETFGEWRRAASPCAGALILWLTRPAAGAGWGVLDSSGRPKAALHHLRRALAPVAVWVTDEGLSGMIAHAANDTATPVAARLRVALYRDGEVQVEQAGVELTLEAHDQRSFELESLIGRFVDITWSYRFGPPAQDLVVASIESGTQAGGWVDLAGVSLSGRAAAPASDRGGTRPRGRADRRCRRRRAVAPACAQGRPRRSNQRSRLGARRRCADARAGRGANDPSRPGAAPGEGGEPDATLTALNLSDRLRVRASHG